MKIIFWQWAWVVDDFGHRHLGRFHRYVLGWLCNAIDDKDRGVNG